MSSIKDIARLIQQLPADVRALAGSKHKEDAYYNLESILEGRGPNRERLEKHPGLARKFESLMSDYWFENFVDRGVDADDDDAREKANEKVGLDLIRMGIIGPRVRASSDRQTLIKFAATLPQGSKEKRTLLAALQKDAGQAIDPADEDQIRSIAKDIKGKAGLSYVDAEVNNWMVRFEFYLASPVQVSIDPKGVSIYVRGVQLPPSTSGAVDVEDYIPWADKQNSAAIRLRRIQKALRGAKTIKNKPDAYYTLEV